MAKIKLYMAMSLDGFISDSNQSVDFLNKYLDNPEIGNHYSKFIDSISDIVMGRKTYLQLKEEFGNEWAYDDQKSHIFSHTLNEKETNYTKIVNEDIEKYIANLKSNAQKDIFVVGGANIVNQLINKDLIDMFVITIVPQLLRDGVKLFDGTIELSKSLKLIKTKKIGDLMYLTYVNEK